MLLGESEGVSHPPDKINSDFDSTGQDDMRRSLTGVVFHNYQLQALLYTTSQFSLENYRLKQPFSLINLIKINRLCYLDLINPITSE